MNTQRNRYRSTPPAWPTITLGRLGAWITGLALSVLVGVPPLAAQPLPDYMYPIVNDAGRMSIAAYSDSPGLIKELESEGWELLQSASVPGGLEFDVWERQFPDGTRERNIAFRGTQGAMDLLVDAEQVALGPIAVPQYELTLRIAREMVEEADRIPGMTVRFTGHSLGGGLAQYAALELGVQAVVFNAAPIQETGLIARALSFVRQKDRSAQRALAENNIWNLRTSYDLVSSAISPGTQFGRQFQFRPVAPTSGQWVGDYSRHSVQPLLDAVMATAPAAMQTGTPAPVAPAVNAGDDRGGIFAEIEIDERDFRIPSVP